ncbi:aconitase domain protein [Catonella morbi ATCC 51271]|uniref:Aconitase domain protein n=1 Tax=Catonella morbi ATCC 51271 TaxID=592026 RepID=V2XZ75_9FIRM|nr:hydratase [Catonella morbi]ESL02043.1 aconitase domain protein [Catonella morbi ATCC 51271]
MIKLSNNGVYIVNGKVFEDGADIKERLAGEGVNITKEEAKKNTLSYGILEAHNKSEDMKNLKLKFDCLASHDITFVGIVQTAVASGIKQFPVPYALTNCHNSLCAVGGTINEDDHMFGLSSAKKFGGMYVPPNLAVIHQFAREVLAGGGRMILGSDSHTRYGALGTMAIGEGGPELVKQLLGQTYDVACPEVVAVRLTGEPVKGVGPQDIALAIIGEVFEKGYVNNKIMEFIGDGIKHLSVDYRIGIDVMTTETTCLSSIWETDEKVKEFYEIHQRPQDYKELKLTDPAYYDGLIEVDLNKIRPMIAMPFHPSNTYLIDEVNKNPKDILHEVEEKAKISFGKDIKFSLMDKIKNGRIQVDQGIIAGCAGGGFENLCAAADILKGKYIGNDEFSMSLYPASQPIYIELVRNGTVATLMETGAVVKSAFCGPCFGAGDVPANGAFSIRHSTRNFPSREGSKPGSGQMASVALMDARSIAATAANKGRLTSACEIDVEYSNPKYFYDGKIYDNRVFNGVGKPDFSAELKYGPNIVPWPKMEKLADDILIKIVSEIHDPVTTTDELIPSGETSSYRSNPLGLAEFTLSRKDPDYVGEAKKVRSMEEERLAGKAFTDDKLNEVVAILQTYDDDFKSELTEIGSAIYAVKPGDGSAREQAASCQRVLGGLANIARSYATKRYRSNVMNWGMIPFIYEDENIPFHKGDFLYIKGIKSVIENGESNVKAVIVNENGTKEIELSLGAMTDEEKDIIVSGCLINYNNRG